ncbi:hypothetical protein PT277_01685 [Acetobacteraceae bacterium ESL0709]|nr:hypothetical protein [Acetobacteraceae bacterium ESL0697]MDF7677413.1 hypothetical protein [Acetobacteraceae bacterium ESL0709]
MDNTALRSRTGKTALEIAIALGLKSHTAVLAWKGDRKIPTKYLLKIEQLFGIPREELRPDLYARHTSPPPNVRSH